MKNNSGPIFCFFSVGFVIELCRFFVFCVINLWNRVSKISGELLELGS